MVKRNDKGICGRMKASEVIAYWPALMPKSVVKLVEVNESSSLFVISNSIKKDKSHGKKIKGEG